MEKQTEIVKYLKCNLSDERFFHSLRVQEVAEELALRFNVDLSDCSMAAISHDICREMDSEMLLGMVCSKGVFLDSGKLKNPILIHGLAGSILLKEQFQISDISILNAVRYHTSGSDELEDVGKVIFAADFLDPQRGCLSSRDRDRIIKLSLDEMVLDIAERIQVYIESTGRQSEPELRKMILRLKKEKILQL